MGLRSTNDKVYVTVVEAEYNELRAEVERLKIREETAKAAIAGSEKEIERLRTGWNECQRYMTLSLGREDALRAEVEQLQNGVMDLEAKVERLKAAVVEIGAAHVAAQAEIDQTWRPEVAALRVDVIAALEQNERFANTIATLRARIDAHNDEWRECPVIES
jgi:chromosome segregation ATPase